MTNDHKDQTLPAIDGAPLLAHQGAGDGSGTVALSRNRSPRGVPFRLGSGTLAISLILLRLA